ncbi:MAG: hypothetical protein E6Q59_04800 [Nitrosomonas sp.]|nr:MAG: hypothetical protein E6Q59_04800 [Nitrosomonas sp.]
MKMISYIEKAEKKAGTQMNLANFIGLTSGYIRMVKAGKRCFSNDVCIKLADYIEEDRLEVIAANSLVTEKDEEKRKIFESCFRKVAGVAAAAVVTSILTLTPQGHVKASNLDQQFTKIQIISN